MALWITSFNPSNTQNQCHQRVSEQRLATGERGRLRQRPGRTEIFLLLKMTPKSLLCVLLFNFSWFFSACSEPVTRVPRELPKGCSATSCKGSLLLSQQHPCSLLSPASARCPGGDSWGWPGSVLLWLSHTNAVFGEWSLPC